MRYLHRGCGHCRLPWCGRHAGRRRGGDGAGPGPVTIPIATPVRTAADLGVGPDTRAWIRGALSLGSAAGLLRSGALGDADGRRRTALAGALVVARFAQRSLARP
jgi:hypothetical protein